MSANSNAKNTSTSGTRKICGKMELFCYIQTQALAQILRIITSSAIVVTAPRRDGPGAQRSLFLGDQALAFSLKCLLTW